jgi:hypothetical protein
VLEEVERTFDRVSAAVGLGVVAERAAALAAAAFAVTGLVGGLGDDRDDAAAAEQLAVAA